MQDIDTILKSVAPDAARPGADVVDADLARGRAALATARRRRRLRGAGAGASVAIATVAAVLVTTSSHHSSSATSPLAHVGIGSRSQTGSAHPATHATRGHATTHPRIELVSYTGAQLPGFTVTQIPQGWQLSTSTSTALLITPDGSPNRNPDEFEGKLAVLPQSVDEHGEGPGEPVTVNGQPGRLDADAGPGLLLRYTTADGHAVDIQAPPALHWTGAQLVSFAEGVTVTANVGVARG